MRQTDQQNLSYEDEQARLQKELDGELRIEVPKEPEVRPEVYRDVEHMLFRGFIPLSTEINGVLFVFKSLNHHEFDLLRFLGGFEEGKEPPSKFWELFLAYCVFLVDGQNILADREHSLPMLCKFFEDYPLQARQMIIRHISEVNRRASRAVTLTEAYSMEQMSRFRWTQLYGLDPTSPAVTGVQGTERLGLNWAQLLWRALNRAEDLRQQAEADWENAKFMGSCFAGKGISKVYAQDQTRRNREREQRSDRKDLLLRHVLLGDPLEGTDRQGKAVMAKAKSFEDLATQLQHDLRGDKDFHDRVIEATEARVRAENDRHWQSLQDLAQRKEHEYEGRDVFGGSDLSGLSEAEVRQRVLRTRQRQAQQYAQRLLHPENEEHPRLREMLARYETSVPPVPVEVSQTDRDPTNVVPLPPPRAPGIPFRR